MSRLMPGAEPFYLPGGPVGCLLTHGFTASPQEVRELGEHLADQGHSVLGVRLAGHGTRLEDMARSRWQDWMASVEDGYHWLRGTCETIFAMGLSTGGVLSLLLSRTQELAGVVSMATPIELPPLPAVRLLAPFLRPLGLLFPSYPKGPPDWYEPQAGAARVAYDAYPLRAVPEFALLARRFERALPEIHVPVLLIHSRQDGFIPPSHPERILAHLGSSEKQLAWVDGSNHIITCDAARQQVFTLASAFVQRQIEHASGPR